MFEHFVQIIKRTPEESKPYLPGFWICFPERIRRIVYVLTFELLAICLSSLLLVYFADGGHGESLVVAAAGSLIAITWNYIFTTIFEYAEERFKLQRTLFVRVMHTLLFEGGLVAIAVPLLMWWYDLGFWEAFELEIGLLVFFLVFTFAFSWAFDSLVARKVFKRPA